MFHDCLCRQLNLVFVLSPFGRSLFSATEIMVSFDGAGIRVLIVNCVREEDKIVNYFKTQIHAMRGEGEKFIPYAMG